MGVFGKLKSLFGRNSGEIEPVAMPRIEARPGTKAEELTIFRAEVRKSKALAHTDVPSKKKQKAAGKGVESETLPVLVENFDKLLTDRGFERGSTTLISGGAGTGKTTFVLQSIYHGAVKGEKGVFISFEEEPDKIKRHMKKNFNWDFYDLEKKGLVAIIKFDPAKIARSVEQALAAKAGTLRIEFKKLKLPFKPDRIGVDSLSALSIAFRNEENYRKYVRQLFETFEEYNSVNFAVAETEQDPKVYSRTGVEEFLADGVVVFYNLKVANKRENALEILKLRSGRHEKRMIPYKLTGKGFEIYLPSKYPLSITRKGLVAASSSR